ncbi:protein of unknown function [Sterolibacterium denitrificans]|uniref:Uncharacterized protein n=1 Tax=Sterolibacterium denitrificans TaxID=157592 RepID=A0A7Z7HQC1_9PROT|nr:protein of unknown function [Sterolibacterium denitrificans]
MPLDSHPRGNDEADMFQPIWCLAFQPPRVEQHPIPLCLAEFRRRRAGLSGFVCLSAASLETGRSAAAKLGKPEGPRHWGRFFASFLVATRKEVARRGESRLQRTVRKQPDNAKSLTQAKPDL